MYRFADIPNATDRHPTRKPARNIWARGLNGFRPTVRRKNGFLGEFLDLVEARDVLRMIISRVNITPIDTRPENLPLATGDMEDLPILRSDKVD